MFFWNSLAFSMIQRMLALLRTLHNWYYSLVCRWRNWGMKKGVLPRFKQLVSDRADLNWAFVGPQSQCCWCAQSGPILCDPMDCSLPGSSVHGIFQERILEWVAIPFSRGSSRPWDWTHIPCVSCTARFFTTASPGKSQRSLCKSQNSSNCMQKSQLYCM